MKVLVCGSRHFNDKELMDDVLNKFTITEIIHGAARGADRMAGVYAERQGIPVHIFPANWDKYGNAAGPIRNQQMLTEGKPEKVIAFLAPDSRGTKHMISISQKAGVPVEIVNI